VQRTDHLLVDCLRRYFDDDVQGLEIICESRLPHGSGLGTSSILAGAILHALWSLGGRRVTEDTLIHMVKENGQKSSIIVD
jgi:galactokinase